MKTIKRMSLGIISSLLLSAGLARAAQQLDPLTQSIGRNHTATVNEASASNCTLPCYYSVNEASASNCTLPCYYQAD
jgi:hypothetical protein